MADEGTRRRPGGTPRSEASPLVGHRISRKHEEALKALTTFETAVF